VIRVWIRPYLAEHSRFLIYVLSRVPLEFLAGRECHVGTVRRCAASFINGQEIQDFQGLIVTFRFFVVMPIKIKPVHIET